MNNVPVTYFTAYPIPKLGEFKITSDRYGENGWELDIKKAMIIGETASYYVTELRPLSFDEWVGNDVVTRQSIVHIGFHKSRFMKWIDTQLELFL